MTNLVNAVTNNVDPNLVYIGEKLDGAIGAISTKLGVAADHFWPILVKKQFIDGIGLGIAILSPLIISLVCWCVVFLRRKINQTAVKDTGECDRFYVGAAIFGLGLIVIFMLATAFNLSEVCNKIFNPEAIALTELLRSLK